MYIFSYLLELVYNVELVSHQHHPVRILYTLFKIHLKDLDDGALHFCILFIRTLSIVQFNKITTFQRLALSPSSGDKRERAKGR
jgi:hypothetical protein